MQPPGWEALIKNRRFCNNTSWSYSVLKPFSEMHLPEYCYAEEDLSECVLCLYCIVSVFDRILKVFLIKWIQIPLSVFPLFLAPPFLWSLVDTEGKKLQRSWTCPRSICLTYPSVYVAVVHWSQWTVWLTGGSVYVWPAVQCGFASLFF